MEQVFRFTVYGKPIAQARPKFRSMKSRAGRAFGMAYNPQETEAGKFAVLVANQLPEGFVPFSGPLEVSALFVMPMPGGSKKKRDAMISGSILPAKKPDASNMWKFFEDCMNGIVWNDDSQICRIKNVEKVYGEHPRTEIEVRLIGGNSVQGEQ